MLRVGRDQGFLHAHQLGEVVRLEMLQLAQPRSCEPVSVARDIDRHDLVLFGPHHLHQLLRRHDRDVVLDRTTAKNDADRVFFGCAAHMVLVLMPQGPTVYTYVSGRSFKNNTVSPSWRAVRNQAIASSRVSNT